MIRWIDRSIGVAPFGAPECTGIEVVDVRSLVDGGANPAGSLGSLVDLGLERLQAVGRVVVSCDLGVSRSVVIAAAIVARRDGVPFDDALLRTQRAIDEFRMDYELVNSVRRLVFGADAQVPSSGTILLTGGSGFLGRWVVRQAGSNRRLFMPTSRELDLVRSPFGLDRAVRAARPSVIVHLANPRMSHVAASLPDSAAMMHNVLDVCRHHGVFLVHASGWIVLNGHVRPDADSFPDDAPCRPRGHYATAKSVCEHMIDLASAEFGLQASILRFSPIYGEGGARPLLLSRFAEALRCGLPVATHRYRNGRPRLQLLHAGDAARAILLATDRRLPGRINVAGDGFPTTEEIARLMANLMGVGFTGHEIPLEQDAAFVRLDCSKAKRALGWWPLAELGSELRQLISRDSPAMPPRSSP